MNQLQSPLAMALLGPSLPVLQSLAMQQQQQQPQEPQESRKRSHRSEECVEELEVVDDLGEISEDETIRFKGVSQHKRSGRWEAHIWISSIQKQAYLGGFETPEQAAEAYDMIALKCHTQPSESSRRKSKAKLPATNFDPEFYTSLLESWADMNLEEAIVSVRRQSCGFSRGSSQFRGVTRHPSSKFEARVGLPGSSGSRSGSKHVYLGLHDDEISASRAYDSALVRMKGPKAATNFPLADYSVELTEWREREESIRKGDGVPVGSSAYDEWVRFGGGEEGGE